MVRKIEEKRLNTYKLLLNTEKVENKEIIKKIENQLYKSLKSEKYHMVDLSKEKHPLDYKEDYCYYRCLVNHNNDVFIDFYKINKNVINIKIIYVGKEHKLLHFKINKEENVDLFEILNEKEIIYLEQEEAIKKEKQESKEKEIDNLIKLI